MKFKNLMIFSTMLLSGCATMSPKPVSSDQVLQGLSSQDQTEFNINMNTAMDNKPVQWHSHDGKTAYQLTTSDTHVNAKGQPCRSYTLVIDRDYHRKKVTTAVACRDENGWGSQSS